MVQNISYVKTGMKYSSRNKATFTINIKWRETYGQLQYVNIRVKNILDNMQIQPTDSVYRTVGKIHDYIVQNVEYDTTLVMENAYSALKDGKSTCQGYSLLFYKLLTEAGIPCRYITGTGISEKSTGPHGWNIVKINDKWYNVDATWDDPIYLNPNNKAKNALSREYFLKGSVIFDKSHIRDKAFKSAEFIKKYIISKTDFVIGNDITIAEIKNDPNKVVEPTLEPVVDLEESEDEYGGGIVGFFKNLMKRDIKNMPGYIMDSYKELEPRQKLIILGLCGIIVLCILLKIVIKIVRVITHKDEREENEISEIEQSLNASNNKDVE